MADGDKDTVEVQVFAGAVFHVFDAHAGNTRVITQHFVEYMVPLNGDLAFLFTLEQAVLQDFFGTQRVPSVNQRDVRGNIGQVQRFLDRGIASANDGNRLLPVEKAVTGRTGGNAPALEGLFGG